MHSNNTYSAKYNKHMPSTYLKSNSMSSERNSYLIVFVFSSIFFHIIKNRVGTVPLDNRQLSSTIALIRTDWNVRTFRDISHEE